MNVGPPPIRPTSPRKRHDAGLVSVVIGAAMPKPSVMLWSAKPTASTPVNAIAPTWADSPMASPSDRLCSPSPVAMASDNDRALVYHPLDLRDDLGPPLVVELDSLLLEQRVDVGVAAVRVGAAADDEGGQAGRRIAEGAARPLNDVLVLLVAPGLEEGGALDRPQCYADADSASDRQKASEYFSKLVDLAKNSHTERQEIREAKAYSRQDDTIGGVRK